MANNGKYITNAKQARKHLPLSPAGTNPPASAISYAVSKAGVAALTMAGTMSWSIWASG